MTFPDGLLIIRKLEEKASGDQIKQGVVLSAKRLYNGSDETYLSVQIKQRDKQDLWTTSRKMAKILPIFFLMAIICNEAPSSTGNMIRSSSVIPTRVSMGSPPLCTTANLWGNIYDPNSSTGRFQNLIERTTNPFPYSAISSLPISLRTSATIMFFTVTFFYVILPIKSGHFAGLATDQPATVGTPPMLMIGPDDASTQIRDFRARPAVLEAVSG